MRKKLNAAGSKNAIENTGVSDHCRGKDYSQESAMEQVSLKCTKGTQKSIFANRIDSDAQAATILTSPKTG